MSDRSRCASDQATRRKLSSEQEVAIRGLAETKSLRSLAAEIGASHETARSVLRQRDVVLRT